MRHLFSKLGTTPRPLIAMFLLGALAFFAAQASAWTGPMATPPGANVENILDVSDTAQSKGGGTIGPGVNFEVFDTANLNNWFSMTSLAAWNRITTANDTFVESLVGPNYVCANRFGILVTCPPPPTPPITVDLDATPTSMTLPANQTMLSWTTTGSPTSCTASLEWSGSKAPGGGTQQITGLTLGTHTYRITCTKAGTPDATDTVTVTVSNTISAHIKAECIDTYDWNPWPIPVDYHQGNLQLKFTFPSPLPAALTLRAAVCIDRPLLGVATPYYDGCWGTGIIPNWPAQPGGLYTSSDAPTSGAIITIPQGATSFTTAAPWMTGTSPNYALTCTEHGGTRSHRGTVGRIKYLYFKITSPSGNPYTLNFTGTSYNLGQLPQPITITQVP